MKYTREEVYNASIKYFDGDDLAADVFANKYVLSHQDEYYEKTPDDMHKRLASEFARIEKHYKNSLSQKQIYNLFKDFKYVVPQGSPMSGIGNNFSIQSISNCFVIDSPHDSYGGICKSDQELIQLMKRRGGVGLDISTIRPKNMKTNNAAKTTDGIGVFMERFSNSCREVAQNGRRGAEMISISVHHPEIMTFIKIKQDKTKVTGANISIKLTNEFLDAVSNDSSYQVRWPVDAEDPKVVGELSAKEIWDEIINSAWSSAEPGLLFWDNVLENTPADAYTDVGFGSISTNPCGEINLSPYDSCRLMLLNLLSFVQNPFTKNSFFDYKKFADKVVKAQRLMDDMIDLEIEKIDQIIAKIKSDPEPAEVKYVELELWKRIRYTCEQGRRTGLGITALGDALAAIGIIYGSEEAIVATEAIYKCLAVNSYKSSIIMAKERGSFPLWDYDKEKNHPFISRIISCLDEEHQEMYRKYGRRNIANTTTAPAGSVSCETRTTSGIECVFLLEYGRRRKIVQGEDLEADFVDDLGDRWVQYSVKHPGFQMWQDITGLTDVKDSPYFGATSVDVNWVNKVKMQAAAQRWICHAISCTVNLPEDVTKEVVSEIYLTGWKSGCKGVTVYRDNCRSGVLISNEDKSSSNTDTIDIVLEDGTLITVAADEEIEYEGKIIKAKELIEEAV